MKMKKNKATSEERFGHEYRRADDNVDMSQDEFNKNEIENNLFKQLDEIVINGATLERQQKQQNYTKNG